MAFALYVGVGALGDATQTRPDSVDPSSRSEVRFEVRAQRWAGSPAEAAANLWGACQSAARRRAVGEVRVDDGVATLVVQPALGRYGRGRLSGCLGDLTLDGVKGRLLDVRPA